MVNRRQRGFSFTEVMIATAILATLGSSLFGAQNHERTALSQSFDQLQAETYAQGVFETLRTKRATLKVGTTELGGLPPGLTAVLEVEALDAGLFGVRVRVEGGRLAHPVVLETRLAAEDLR